MSDGAVMDWNQFMVDWNRNTLAAAGKHYGFAFDYDRPVKDLGEVEKDLLYWGVYDERFRRHFPGVQPPETVRTGRFEGIATNLLRRYAEHIENSTYLQRLEGSVVKAVCPACGGTRLKEYSRRVTVLGGDIFGLAELPLSDLLDWVTALKTSLPEQALIVAQPIIADLEDRIACLVDAGVGYLSMSRASTTLSGGEAQRIRLAALLGSGLTFTVSIPTGTLTAITGVTVLASRLSYSTYWTTSPIRNLYAALPESKDANLTARDFSFNVPGGRCERLPVALPMACPLGSIR